MLAQSPIRACLRGARQALDRGAYAEYARTRLGELDRHEHDPSRRSPGRRLAKALPSPTLPRSASSARFEVVLTSQGAPAVRDAQAGEVMHPVVGAVVESERLYVAQSHLGERLAESGGPFTLFDVGLGAGSNALAALRAARAAPACARRLLLLSFERDLGALELACSESGAHALGLSCPDRAALCALLSAGVHEEPRASWRLLPGDLLETLLSESARADLVFWDPYSPRVNPELWTVLAFRRLRERCGEAASVFTYSTATSVRAALLLSGFYVGVGNPSGPKQETTAAATRKELLARPLEARWLERLDRSSAPLPADAPGDALERLRAHPQFR